MRTMTLLTLALLAVLVWWLWSRRTAAPTAAAAARATTGRTVASVGTCDRHPSALAKYVAAKAVDDGDLLELTLCGHCRIVHAKALYDQGWDVIDADECDTMQAVTT